MGLLLTACSTAFAAALALAPADGTVRFALTSTLHPIEGRAPQFDGTLDTDTLVGAFTVDATALTTGLGARDSRMTWWCLDTSHFPTLAFAVSRIGGAVAGLRSGAGGGAITLDGTLTIRDVAHDVSIPATYAWEGNTLRLKGRHEMKWTDWNLPDPSIVLSRLSPDMVVSFDVLARPS